MPSDLPPLAERLLAHLVREEAALQASRAALDGLYLAFLQGNFGELQQAVDGCGSHADEVQRIRDARTALCSDLGSALGVEAEAITLSVVASRLPPPYSGRVTVCRDRLQALAADVERLTQRAAGVVGYCRTYIQKLLAEMTDTGAATPSYAPGRRSARSAGALIVAEG